MERSRIESEEEVKGYIQNLRYALTHGGKLILQAGRIVDIQRAERGEERFTNEYTVAKLFWNEDLTEGIKRELLSLSPENYVETVKDTRFPERSEMRVFGKIHDGDDIYIKIRVELVNMYGETTTFVMSFHYAKRSFVSEDFPYRKR